MIEQNVLTAQDLKLLAYVERVLENGDEVGVTGESVCPVCLLLTDTVPQAKESFQSQLKRKLVGKLTQKNKKTFLPRNLGRNKDQTSLLRLLVIPTLGLIIVAIAFVLTTSWGQTFAQEVIHFFTRSDSQTVTIEITQPVLTSTSVSTESSKYESQVTSTIVSSVGVYSDFSLTISDVEQIAGFEVREPMNLPPGYHFRGAKYDQKIDGVTLLYVFPHPGPVMDSEIRILQHRGDFEGLIGPEAEVQTVIIGGVQGEYVQGGWLYKPESLEPALENDPGAIKKQEFQWERTMVPLQILRWKEVDLFYEISFVGSDTQEGFMLKEDLVSIAVGME